MESNKRYRVMSNLNHPVRFIGFTLDEGIVALVASVFLIMSSHRILVLLVSYLIFSMLRGLKKNRGPKYLIVLLYRYFPACITRWFLPKMPDSSHLFWRH